MDIVHGQPSFSISSDLVQAWVTQKGGHAAPVKFDVGGRVVEPLHVAPWAESPDPKEPEIIQVLRGDFFCLPFGGNDASWRGEKHPVHGETANREWRVTEQSAGRIVMEMDLSVRRGKAVKEVWTEPGHCALYQRHRVDGEGPMSYGHHAMLAFPPGEEGRISVSPFARGQVFPGTFEEARQGGYSCLRPGALFDRLEEVPLANGGEADLSRYPAREGHEDLVQVFASPGLRLAWTACVFSSGWLWLALKDPRILTGTVMWHSNGGRHYAPWSGRHRRVLGVEEVTSWFHTGLAESAEPNPASEKGFITCGALPLESWTIMACAAVPEGFDVVRKVLPTARGVAAVAESGREVELRLSLPPLS